MFLSLWQLFSFMFPHDMFKSIRLKEGILIHSTPNKITYRQESVLLGLFNDALLVGSTVLCINIFQESEQHKYSL